VNPDAAPSVDISHEDELIATVFKFPPILTAPVEVPVFILVAKLELLFIFTAPPDVVNAPSAIVNESPDARV